MVDAQQSTSSCSGRAHKLALAMHVQLAMPAPAAVHLRADYPPRLLLPRPCFQAEYFIPAGILLKCFLEVSDRELYDKLVQSVAGVRRGALLGLAAPNGWNPPVCLQRVWRRLPLATAVFHYLPVLHLPEPLPLARCTQPSPLWSPPPPPCLRTQATARLWRSERSCCCARRRALACTRAQRAWSTWATCSAPHWMRRLARLTIRRVERGPIRAGGAECGSRFHSPPHLQLRAALRGD